MSLSASTTSLKGTVVNGTTNMPGAGDEVVLLGVSKEGMNEVARGKVDRGGHFSLPVTDNQNATQVVRVIHEGIVYHTVVDGAAKRLVIKVYDVATKVEGISAVMDVQRFEATGDSLEIKQLVTMRNQSKPPRTLVKDRPFEIQLPRGSQVVSGMIQIETHQPLKQKPIRGEQDDRYYFSSPIRPGDTRFAIVYKIPYNGETLIEPTVRNPSERFVVMLPNTMKFEPATAGIFRPMPGSSPDNVQATGPVSARAVVAFRVSGTGTLEELKRGREEAAKSTKTERPRPGGGLGAPIDTPDPLYRQRWLILVCISASIGLSATWTLRRASRLAQVSERIAESNIRKVRRSRNIDLRSQRQRRQ